jgi:aerobic-type carbon monoxide dehydrogenase small subunit (CoxS/CutS family)
MIVAFTLNGRLTQVDVKPGTTLLEYIRGHGIHSPKQGCDHGECGACAVLVDGLSQNACLLLVAQLEGRSVETLEVLNATTEMQALQEAFLEHGAVQCGYCTPGMLIALIGLQRKRGKLNETDIREALSGQLCRCTGYVKPVEAALTALGGTQR